MSLEDQALVPQQTPAPGPQTGARDRLLWLIQGLAQASGMPLPVRTVVGVGGAMAAAMIRTDEDALALNGALRVFVQLSTDYVDGLPVDIEAGQRQLAELAERFDR